MTRRPEPKTGTDSSDPDALPPAVSGSQPPLDARFALVYDELKRMAQSLRAGKAGETLNATALVHEAYLKLSASSSLQFRDASHLLAIAARAMRQILVDAARRRSARKRGADAAWVTLSEDLHGRALEPDRLLALDGALRRLESLDERRAAVAEYKVFGGLDSTDIASLLGVSRPTVDRDWRAARAWLASELEDPRS